MREEDFIGSEASALETQEEVYNDLMLSFRNTLVLCRQIWQTGAHKIKSTLLTHESSVASKAADV